ncbi:amidohydrolase [Stenotrophomonas panacihumi]|uniref:Amidohydrolase n=1 Tax=Stenotrophomonas panacihumi TaxID=676599 RepID=A0A0R0ACV0_9GAMM|nr:amidohydrolase [Stenotrophomonas panacihumi]KRG38760.1 amidohydrolase [Stenotrophomonas panacihumi]PTN55946.1 amidohydrolase [Stenotrophomonas panacihumi]
MRAWTLALPLLFACAAASAAPRAEVTVLEAGHIYTSDPAQPQVKAIAWGRDGRLLAAGDPAVLVKQYPHARRISLPNATLLPGLIDAHGHVMGLGWALLQANLVGSGSKQEVLARLQAFEKTLAPGAWLTGSGWDQNDWPDKAFPTAADLDAAFPDRPVWLERIDGHAGWANSAALKLAVARQPKMSDAGWQPEGGRIERTAGGQPAGVLVDGAMPLMHAVMPAPDQATRERALSLAVETAVRNGLTGVHDMGTSREDLALMRQFADQGRLPLRIDTYADGDSGALADLCANGLYTHAGGRLKMGGVKLYMDGALGSRGAALLQDYSDDHGNRGLLVTEPVAYAKAVAKAKSCGVQVATHAIGDRGNRIVLDTYEKTLGADRTRDHRWRVEHAQVLSPEDLPRFAPLGVIASMQPTHATSDMPWAQDRLGPQRILGAYAWHQLLDSGARLALGSDFPVESPDPRLGLYAAVTRQDRAGQPPGGWLPAQKLSLSEALRGFTADAAYAGFDEQQVGQLKAGLHADFVVLDQDPFAVPESALDELRIRSTWVDGEAVYQNKQ